MTAAAFALDPRLAADTVFLRRVGFCRALMMDDARYPWLILVPERAGLSEVFDLDAGETAAVLDLTARIGGAMKPAFSADKINIGMLGNIVTQLHIHIVARHADDFSWPGPVWGSGPRVPLSDAEKAARAQALLAVLDRAEA